MADRACLLVRRCIAPALCLALSTSPIARPSALAQSPAGRPFTSVRYGYALTLAPGWVLRQGDCAPYALAISADKTSSMKILVTAGSSSSTALQQAEATATRANGRVHGAITFGTLHLRAATYRTARAITSSRGVTYSASVAGVVRNQRTYLVIALVRDPTGRGGRRDAKATQDMLASMTFARPARPGAFSCTGAGVSRALVAHRAGRRAPTATGTMEALVLSKPRATRVPAMSRTATATPRATQMPSSSPTPSNTATATGTATGTATPTGTPSWTPTPTWTATATATWTPPTWTVTATATAVPTATSAASGIPTAGATQFGCAITPDQAAGEAHLLGVLNADRAAANVPPLTLSNALSVASRNHSCDMGVHDPPGRLSPVEHNGSDGTTWDRRIAAAAAAAGISNTMSGENVGTVTGLGITGGIDYDDQLMMAEPLAQGDHHWNIVNAGYRYVGLGVIYLNGTVWITEDFVG